MKRTASRSGGLDIWMNGLYVGRWWIASGTHALEYAADWLHRPEARPISLSLPLLPEGATHRGALVESFFENLLPENDTLRRRMRTRFGARSTHAFDLLACVGTDCVGALQLLPHGEEPPGVRSIQGVALDEHDVARHLRHLTAGPDEEADEDDLRLSIAGAQVKTALLRHGRSWQRPLGSTPSTHILKLPLGIVGGIGLDLRDSVENEWLCLHLLRALGFTVPASSMATFEDQKVLVVQRFDRRLSPDSRWWQRLPQEDACQALGVAATRKYESDGGPGIATIMRLLEDSQEASTDRRTFFAAQVAFWLLAATDGHAKNFSIFLEPGGRFRLTPLYDVLSVLPLLGPGKGQVHERRVKLAMAFRDKGAHRELGRIQRRHVNVTARACGLVDGAEPIIRTLLDAVPTAVADVRRSLPADFPDRVATPILDGLVERARLLETMPAS